MDPDPGGQKTYGSGSGSGTLVLKAQQGNITLATKCTTARTILHDIFTGTYWIYVQTVHVINNVSKVGSDPFGTA
jgi:hypothetical protein